MSFSDDIEAMAHDMAQIPKRLGDVTVAVSDELKGVIHAQFDTGTDPDGAPWHPLSIRTLMGHGPPPLTDTGDMKRTLGVHVHDTTIEFSMDDPAQFHQRGHDVGARTKLNDVPMAWGGQRKELHGQRLPQRKIFPTGSELPAQYHAAVARALDRTMGLPKAAE
jgi:hypothetical protein